jgi:hypothetical protein
VTDILAETDSNLQGKAHMRGLKLYLAGAGILLSQGCMEPAPDAATEPASEGATEQEVGQTISRDFLDASGTVKVRIKECAPTTIGEIDTATCAVDNGFVLIGGGAEIFNDVLPGALLTASFPDSELTTWTVSSKAHDILFPHQLAAYSVGLELAGVSAATLQSSMVFVRQRSAPAEHPSVGVTLPPGFQIIGGGARANWVTSGLLLTSSLPQGSQWLAAAKDHVAAETGSVDAFAIGITTGTIPGFGSLDISVDQASTSTAAGTGSVSLSVPTGSVLTSIGGQAQFNGGGRLLTELIPFANSPTDTTAGASVSSTDHEVGDSGITTAYVVSARKH